MFQLSGTYLAASRIRMAQWRIYLVGWAGRNYWKA